jgi:hypothetical protein
VESEERNSMNGNYHDDEERIHLMLVVIVMVMGLQMEDEEGDRVSVVAEGAVLRSNSEQQ